MKAKHTIKLDEQKYKQAFEPLNKTLSLLALRDDESLNQLVKIGKATVRRAPHFKHGHIVLTIAYYRQKEYDLAYEASLKAVAHCWDHNIIPVLGYLYLYYKNHFQFVQTAREIFEEESIKIDYNATYDVDLSILRDKERYKAWEGAIDKNRIEHHRQDDILGHIETALELISFKKHFAYPTFILHSPNDFQEILDLCGLDTPFHVYGTVRTPLEEGGGYVEKTNYNWAEHIWTDSDRSLTVYTNYGFADIDKDPPWGSYIMIEGEANQVIKFNSLLSERLKRIAPHDHDYDTLFRNIPREEEWVPGRFLYRVKLNSSL